MIGRVLGCGGRCARTHELHAGEDDVVCDDEIIDLDDVGVHEVADHVVLPPGVPDPGLPRQLIVHLG